MIRKVRHGRCTPMVTQRVLSLVHMQMALVIACTPPWCAQCSETLTHAAYEIAWALTCA